MPSAQQAQEQVNPEVASKTLVESYSKEGPTAVIKLLEKIPDSQRQPILDKVFEQLGSKDPKAAFTLMQEIIGSGKEEQIKKILNGFEEKEKQAPDANQKTFWKAQKLLFEAGENENSEKTTREAFTSLSLVEPETLPAELKEMAIEQKQYLEMNTR